jgi:hypothetical protein
VSKPIYSLRGGEEVKMAMSGSLGEVMGRVYELFMENRISVGSTIWFLSRLKHEDGAKVFSEKDVSILVNKLIEEKEDIGK